jgi:hypothetical protein
LVIAFDHDHSKHFFHIQYFPILLYCTLLKEVCEICQYKVNTEDEKNGYVVFKGNIRGSVVNCVDGDEGKRYSALPHPFLQAGFWTDICIKTI